MKLYRNILLISFTILLLITQPIIFSQANTADAWKNYLQNPDNHSNIPNNSYAGYQYGEKPIPNYPVVLSARDFGAVGDGKTESGQAINAAIKAASQKGGGAVLLPAGTYLISDVIWINYDGVVLRGEGPEKTVLKMNRPLSEIYQGPTLNKQGNSDWQQNGGFIWFAPQYQAHPVLLWKRGKPALITSDSGIGEDKVTVDNGSLFAPGNKVTVIFEDNPSETYQKDIIRGLTLAHNYNWSEKDPKIFKTNLLYPLEIAGVNGNTVIFKQPLRLPVRKGAKIALIKGLVQNSGVERLSVLLKGNDHWIHHRELGYNGLYFDCAWDCWARDVWVYNAETSVGLLSSKCITIKNIALKGTGRHHGIFSARCSDNLVTDFKIETSVYHGINFDSFSHGNVYCNGVMQHGTLDYHRGLAFDNIITNIVINNDGDSSGDEAPRFGARNVHWNIRVTNGRAYLVCPSNLMPFGAVVGIEGCKIYEERQKPDYKGEVNTLIEGQGKKVMPENLYFAQVKLRLGYLPGHLIN